MSKQHNYDFNSVEEIIRSAEKAGLSLFEIANRLDLTRIEFLKWYKDFQTFVTGHHTFDKPPVLTASQERMEHLLNYCIAKGFFPLIDERTSRSSKDKMPYPQYGRSDNFRDEMITAWRRFIDEHNRHPSSNELISQLEMRSNTINKTEVNYQNRTISIHSKTKSFGNSKQPFEQIYARIKKKVLQ